MEATKRRIFVGNLPCEMTESDLKERFNKFGNVKKVEIKNSNNVSTQSSCYAFLDLEIEASLLDTCFRSLSKQNWNGHSIKLELAKESFLSRLQRERQEENSKPFQAALPADECDTKDDYLNKAKAANHKQSTTSNKKRKHSSGDDKYGRLNEEIDPDSRHLPSDILSKPTGTSDKSENLALTENSLKKGLLQKFESFSDVWKDPPSYTTHKRLPTYKAHKQSEKHSDTNDDLEIVPQNEDDTLKLGGLTSSLKEKSTRNRTFDSEEKRLKSIETREKSFMQQKQAVALALASVDSNIKTNNKIIFDDGFNEESVLSKDHKQKSNDNLRKGLRGPNLFEDETPGEEEQEYDFNIRRQFEGRKGQKLLDLQSKYADDKRFTLDDRFYESDNNDEGEKGTNTAKEDSINDERTRQIEILQSIVGSNLPFTPEERKGKHVNVDSMVVHYDPTRDDHAKYEIKRDIPKKVVLAPSKGQERKLEEKREKKKHRRELPTVQLPAVSKETFYKVSESLKESLKTGDAKGFSLLETFGSIDKEESTTNEDTYSFIPTTNKKKSTHQSSNPFKWDSSDSEDEPDDAPTAVHVTSPSLQQQQQPVQAQGIWRESFFFKANDDRLNEGLKFFGQEEPSTENFSARRREVQQILRAKVKHNVRISAPIRKNLGGRKQNKFKGGKSRK